MTVLTESIPEWQSGYFELLVASGTLTLDDAKSVLAEASGDSTAAVVMLAERGLVESARGLNLLAHISGLDQVDLEVEPPERDAMSGVSLDLARKHRLLGYRVENGRLCVAIAHPLDPAVLQKVEVSAGKPISRTLLADATLIDRLLAERELEEAPTSRAGRSTARRRHPSVSGTAVLDELLRYAVDNDASDLHLAAGLAPSVRIDGAIRPLASSPPLSGDEVRTMILGTLSPDQRERFERDLELDTAYSIAGVGHFRMNVFQQRASVGAVLRVIPGEVPAFETLGLPGSIAELAQLRRGLVLLTGPTGSGKSTTLASMLDIINATKPLHIMTVEDPIEFVHPHRTAIVNQREVGVDTYSFAASLRHVLRQDPDVILIGEMRDLETISIALTAAETGHLVLSTVHTPDAPQTIDRVVDVFPESQQPQIRTQLANVLEAVVTQQLVVAASGIGRVPIAEVMICTPAVRNLIRTGKTHQLYSLIQTGGDNGMQTMDLGLARAVRAGLISEPVAFDRAHDAQELRDHLAH